MAIRKAPPAFLLMVSAMLAQSGAQDPAPAAYAPTPPGSIGRDGPAPRGIPARVADRLLGPIALYPDPLLALILPASTVPEDIRAASAYLVQYADTTRIDSQPWDPSVRALAHYPAIVSWMADNIEWTRAVGSAFLASPSEVMQSIQRLRARALASGALKSTPQQQVVVQDSTIEILPAEPESIYAPAYDAGAVFPDEPSGGYGGPGEDLGPAQPAGPWLSYGLDWVGWSVWVGDWGAWRGPGGWHHTHDHGGHGPPGSHPWRPHAPGPGAVPPAGWRAQSVPLPRPPTGTPVPRPANGPSSQPADASAVPVPKTPAPPMDRPRLAPSAGTPAAGAQAAQAEPRGAEAAAAPDHGAPPGASAPAASRGSAPAPSHESAPVSSHGSAPVSFHESAPAAEGRSR
ncbi:MAG: DUF3300 domain-containing protein [Opitutaceae bacterium]|jgi:hypothetical protein